MPVYTHSFPLETGTESAFELFADPRHLDALTPSWFRIRPLSGFPPSIEAGTEIAYRLRWRGLALRWTSVITDWCPPDFFAYEQRRGPYRHFRHEHFFTPVDGATEIRDQVLFRAPGGALADRLIARPDLERIFEFRERRAPELLTDLQSRRLAALGSASRSRSSSSKSPIERRT